MLVHNSQPYMARGLWLVRYFMGDWTLDLPHTKPVLYHQVIEALLTFFEC